MDIHLLNVNIMVNIDINVYQYWTSTIEPCVGETHVCKTWWYIYFSNTLIF